MIQEAKAGLDEAEASLTMMRQQGLVSPGHSLAKTMFGSWGNDVVRELNAATPQIVRALRDYSKEFTKAGIGVPDKQALQFSGTQRYKSILSQMNGAVNEGQLTQYITAILPRV